MDHQRSRVVDILGFDSLVYRKSEGRANPDHVFFFFFWSTVFLMIYSGSQGLLDPCTMRISGVRSHFIP